MVGLGKAVFVVVIGFAFDRFQVSSFGLQALSSRAQRGICSGDDQPIRPEQILRRFAPQNDRKGERRHLSKSTAIPIPPETQRVAIPVFASRFFISYSSVVT